MSEAFTNMPADPLMLDLFRIELENHTRVLEAGLVQAESDQRPEKMEPLMRAAHSIKGAARIVGLTPAVGLAHAMEDVLSAAQHGKHRLLSNHVDALLAGNDIFLSLSRLDTASLPAALQEQTGKIAETARQILSILDPTSALSPKAQTQDAETVAPPVPVRAAPATDVKTDMTRPPAAAPPPAKAEAVCQPALHEKAEGAVVRVMAENLNRLMGLAGECLVQSQSVKVFHDHLLSMKKMLLRLEQRLQSGMEAQQDEACMSDLAGLQQAVSGHIGSFERFSRKLEHLVHRLYGEVISSRMVPFADGLHGFSRMVRDVARDVHKKVVFETRGESTPVDRDILEKLEAPLSHLLRNAVDHGLETPQHREAAGKPAEGKIILEARHMAGMLNISITDDGRGIDPEVLRRKIVEKGYTTPEMAANLSRTELFEFLFLPGFSTAGALTEISGRGVGLDVVFTMAQEVGGAVRVESEPGRGSRFDLQLPLTLSVLRTLLIDINSEPYALPLSRVDRLLKLPREALQEIENRQFCTIDEEHVGIIDARQLFQLPAREDNTGPLQIVVVSDRMNRYGLVVDHFIGEQNLVVRPLDARLGKVPNISAGAILDDGSPAIILDADDLVRSIHNLLTHAKLHKLGDRRTTLPEPKKRILVVDDSLTVREVERRLLENQGYDVTVAVDGMDGWNSLQKGEFDLIISDIDMPRMNGIELVRKIKADPRLRELPVMIVSYKDREEDRLMGLEAGANYYLTKGSFHDESLLNAVRDLIGGP
jgi:two-component system sensor histidine kinase and response regulator WspE